MIEFIAIVVIINLAIYVGIIIANFTKEELKVGKIIFQKLYWVLFSLLILVFLNIANTIALLVMIVLSFLAITEKKLLPKLIIKFTNSKKLLLGYLLWPILLIVASPSNFIWINSILFMMGLCVGSLLYIKFGSIKSASKSSLVYSLASITIAILIIVVVQQSFKSAF